MHDIRTPFTAGENRCLIGMDYSQQEQKVLASLAKEEKMIEAFKAGRDIYSTIASIAFDLPYEDCLEKYPDGTTNEEGKSRRGQAKAITLGICYSKGIPAIATDLLVSIEKAQEIYDSVLGAFPGIKKYMEYCHNYAHEHGYVETFFGRRRRVPDLFLPDYSIEIAKGYEWKYPDGLNDVHKNQILQKLENAKWYKDKQLIVKDAISLGISVVDNKWLKAKAERQLLNSSIQSSSASITKRAMILIRNNKRLQELGVYIVLSIHDEVQCSCPKKNAFEAVPIIEKCMIEAGKDLVVPLTCDCAISDCWYGDEYEFDSKGNLVKQETHKEKEVNEIYEEEDDEDDDIDDADWKEIQ